MSHLSIRIEYAITGRGRCGLCGDNIVKNQIRMRGYVNSCYSHVVCWADPIYNKRLPDRPQQLYGYHGLRPKDQKYVMKTLWPLQVPDEDKPKLQITKDVEKMTGKELRLELLKRGLRKIGKKQELLERLDDYLHCDDVRCYNDLKVMGFIRKYEQKDKINIPVVLKKLILRRYTGKAPILQKDKAKARKSPEYEDIIDLCDQSSSIEACSTNSVEIISSF